MVAAALVCQAGVVARQWSLSVDVQSPQPYFIVQKGFGIVSIGQINPDHLLISGVEVVEPPGGWRVRLTWTKRKRSHLSIVARAVGRLMRLLAVRMVLRFVPSLLIDSIWEQANVHLLKVRKRYVESLLG